MNRLLVPHDFSQGAERALLRAVRLCAKREAALRVFHCDGGRETPAARSALLSRLLGEAQTMAEELGGPCLDVSARIAFGDPADAILAEAESFDADLIVMGAHGAPRFRDVLFGTTATHVVRHGDRPVLVVRDIGRASYPKMMIAIDDPLDVQRLLSAAFAVAPGANVVAVHAFSPTLVQTFLRAEELEQQEARLKRQIEDAVTAATATEIATRPADRLETVVETGEVLSVLMKAYEARQPPLLVLGNRARTTYLGSRAVDTLFWCPGDVLVVPDRLRVQPDADIADPPLASQG